MIEINFINDYDQEYDCFLAEFEKVAKKTIEVLGKDGNFEISVTLLNNNEIHEMNRLYREKDYPTDVISFENDQIYHVENYVDLGDIFISVDKAIEQANEYKHSINRELIFLFVHGLLHCFGYDHILEKDEKIMFHLQEVILDEKRN